MARCRKLVIISASLSLACPHVVLDGECLIWRKGHYAKSIQPFTSHCVSHKVIYFRKKLCLFVRVVEKDGQVFHLGLTPRLLQQPSPGVLQTGPAWWQLQPSPKAPLELQNNSMLANRFAVTHSVVISKPFVVCKGFRKYRFLSCKAIGGFKELWNLQSTLRFITVLDFTLDWISINTLWLTKYSVYNVFCNL